MSFIEARVIHGSQTDWDMFVKIVRVFYKADLEVKYTLNSKFEFREA